MFYTVGEVAKKLNIAPSTLRYYDKEGLLPFVERSGSGIRMFKDSDFEWLLVIECLKKTSMPIREIKNFIEWWIEGDSTIDKRLALIEQQREAVLSQMRQMQETLDMLDYKRWYYETAKKTGTCAVHETIGDEDVPAEFRDVRKKTK